MNPSEYFSIDFNDADLLSRLRSLSIDAFNRLPFGVIGFDKNERVVIYNDYEAECAGLAKDEVIGEAMFYVVAPCMNNYLVAERFREALAQSASIDETLNYVLTLRMRPTPVVMRMLATGGDILRFLLIHRQK